MPVEFQCTAPPTVQADPVLRSTLLEYYITQSTTAELTRWLSQLGQDTQGTPAEKAARVRENTQYLDMPAAHFPQQTIHYLDPYSSDHLAGICETLGLDASGNKDGRWRRFMRHVAVRERWVSLPNVVSEDFFTAANTLPFIHWHQVTRRGGYEKDFYAAFADDMEGFFGESFVHAQLAIAFGTTLKIDFHLGHPQKSGVGVELKMPTSNAELQRALGQLDQYKERYGANLVVMLLPDFLERTQQQLFLDSVAAKGIAVVVK